MEGDTRFIIDYINGGSWQLPLHLFENFEAFCITVQQQTGKKIPYHLLHERWLNTLSIEEQNLISKK
jgi:hypothetical protein